MKDDFFSARIVTARRPYFCSGCKSTIDACSRYVTVGACSDGRYWSQWLHVECFNGGPLPALEIEPTAQQEAAR